MLDYRFNSVEVLEMAKDIEKRGLDFYKNQAKKTDNNEMKEILIKLASDEEDHYKIFDNLEKNIREKDKNVWYVYDQEVSAYLEALVKFTVFPIDGGVNIDTMEEAIKLAIQAEKDSILFYKEMLENNEQKETRDVLKKIIEEEKKHLLDLVKYDAQLG